MIVLVCDVNCSLDLKYCEYHNNTMPKMTNIKQVPFYEKPAPKEPLPINDEYYDILISKYGQKVVKPYFKPMGVRG